LKAESNKSGIVGIYDPNADPNAVIEPSPEAVTLAKHLFDSELSEKQERYCASVRQLFAAVLAPQLKAEMEACGTDAAKTAWAAFGAGCKEAALPHLPAPPEALLLAIADETDTAAAERMVDVVSRVHTNIGENDPENALVRAALRLMREDTITDGDNDAAVAANTNAKGE